MSEMVHYFIEKHALNCRRDIVCNNPHPVSRAFEEQEKVVRAMRETLGQDGICSAKSLFVGLGFHFGRGCSGHLSGIRNGGRGLFRLGILLREAGD